MKEIFEIINFNGQGHYYWKKNGNKYFGEYLNGIFYGEGLYKCNKMNIIKDNIKIILKKEMRKLNLNKEKKFIFLFYGKLNGIGIYENPKGKRKEVEFINSVINKNIKMKKSKKNKCVLLLL